MAQTIPLVTFITVNYNQTQLTLELIASIYQYVEVPFEIIVVDNHSKISPQSEIDRIYPDVRVIVSGVNRGFAGGNNLGIKISKGQFLFFINNDAVLTKGAVSTILASFNEPSIGVVSPLICYYPTAAQQAQPDIIQYAGATDVNPYTGRNTILGDNQIDLGQYNQAKPTFYAHGAAMVIKRAVLEEVGMMSEYYFLYYEELDWCERIRRAGYTILFQPSAKVYHKESVSVGKTNPMKTYYLNRNRILFLSKNRTKMQFLLFSFFFLGISLPWNALKFILKGEWKHLKAFWQAICWNYLPNKERKKILETKELKCSSVLKTVSV
jgi:GT2 family glycosyltransferase